jgi:ABC-type sugar transport system ATPase subunit
VAVSIPLLKLIGIRKSFPGVVALNGIDLEVSSGEVLALIGANGAGKSTLMNVLGGVVRMDAGRIEIDGTAVDLKSPLDATEIGIAFVHQEMALLPTMSIADNMYISGFPRKSGLIDYTAVESRCAEVLGTLGCAIPPRRKIQNLGAGDRQMVEIARALLSAPRIIIFDEPTSSLSSAEKARLFGVIRSLREGGSAIISITPFLDEIFSLCDRALVLRNGEVAGGGKISGLDYGQVVKLMLGGVDLESSKRHRTRARPAGEVSLKVTGLEQKGSFEGVSLQLRSGEVVGLWGLLGSGRSELARALAGLDPVDGGTMEVRVRGGFRKIRSSGAKKWIGMITENRREDGLLSQSSIRKNISLASLPSLMSAFWPFIDERREKAETRRLVEKLEIKSAGMEQTVATLSGGNQQKVILSRWLQKNPPILIMDEPTRGLDVGAKLEIQSRISSLAQEGSAILVISSEIEEIMSISDRYIVIYRGRIVAELGPETTKEKLLSAAVGASPGGST